MPKWNKPPVNWLHFVYHFGTELSQVAEILNRLRRAEDLLTNGKADPPGKRLSCRRRIH